MLVAKPDHVFVMCDLNQAESWVVANVSGDENMKIALAENRLHETTASSIYEKPIRLEAGTWVGVSKEERYTGKRVNHASAYRMSPEQFTRVYNKDSPSPISIKQSKKYNVAWHALYPNIKQVWWTSIEEQLNRNRTLTTLYGRKRMFFAQWGDKLFKEATAFNPQSTVADHFNGMVHPELGIKGGLLEIYRQITRHRGINIVNQSHDSAMLEVPTSCAREIGEQMSFLLKRPIPTNDGNLFTIPVDCEIGERWGEMEKVKFAA